MERLPWRLVVTAVLLFAAGASTIRAAAISDVSVSRPFFNPFIGQKIGISFSLAHAGTVSVLVLDRDGYPVRTLVPAKAAEAGRTSIEWDGRADSGAVVSDEAYSLKIDLSAGGRTETYLPASNPAEPVSVTTNYYDRRGGTLSYRLEKAARIHIQAGTSVIGAQGQANGPVLKTVVDREPRPAGSVVESWNGFDERGALYVPSLTHFVLAFAATSLPENVIIVAGGRGKSFVDLAGGRTGVPLFAAPSPDHSHHRGLSALDDKSPRLVVSVAGSTWLPAERAWYVAPEATKVTFSLAGPTAARFERQPGKINVFLDEQLVAVVKSPSSGSSVRVSLNGLTRGQHTLAANWVSAYGPVAVDAMRVTTDPDRLVSASAAK